jgi:hypothetical protein
MMTTDKARKRAVRSRMTKTGERYAAARRHVVAAEPAGALPPRVADPGLSDESIRRGTGRGWNDWLRDLDAWGAVGRTHTEIARYVAATYPVTGWWAQSITVGYERARGLRGVHQTSRGFEVSVSRTLPLGPADAWPWLIGGDRRHRWIEDMSLEVAANREFRWLRFARSADGSMVRLTLDPKGDERSVLTVTQSGLAGAADVAARRATWRERLGRLTALLGTPDEPS